MSEINAASPAGEQIASEGEIDILDVMFVMAKQRRKLIAAPFITAALAAIVSFALPDYFKATTTLMPPQQAQSGAAAMLAQLGGAASAVAGVAGLKNPNDLYIGMLKSRTVADNLIKQYDLKKAYDLDSQEKTRRVLEESTLINTAKSGLITIEVEGKEKALVAKIANSYVAELIKLTKVLAVTEAGQRRVFYESQLEISKDNLAVAEAKLKGALDTRGFISVDTESRAILENVSRLRAQVSAKEIQLNSMRAFVTSNNPDFKRNQEELSSLKAELGRLENGRPAQEPSGPATASKSAGLENIKVLRDVKYYQMLYELLAKQYELARLDEAKDTAVVQVLDPAIDPEKKFKPRRVVIILIGALLGLIAAIVGVVVAEAKARAQRVPARAAKMARLRNSQK